VQSLLNQSTGVAVSAIERDDHGDVGGTAPARAEFKALRIDGLGDRRDAVTDVSDFSISPVSL
jgi:hypothetical protein